MAFIRTIRQYRVSVNLNGGAVTRRTAKLNNPLKGKRGKRSGQVGALHSRPSGL